MQYQIVRNPYSEQESLNRKGLLISGGWDDKLLSIIEENAIEALYLNCSKGWSETDYSFLSSLDMIKELDIISSIAKNISALGKMSGLEELSLTVVPDSDIDFSEIKCLKKVFLEWSPKYLSISDCVDLNYIYLNKFKKKHGSVLSGLEQVKELILGNSDIDNINFIQNIQFINTFELLNCKSVQSFEPISSCINLKRIRIDGYKNLGMIDFLKPLLDLEILILNDVGGIQTIECLEKLIKLKAVSFAGTTNIIDGQLFYLMKLPLLSMVLFYSRKHYSHKIIKSWNWNNLNIPDRVLDEI